MAKASPLRSGDVLAGLAARDGVERIAAQHVLADVPLIRFLEEYLVPPETDEVTRLILETHDAEAFKPVAGLSVGEFRDWLLRYETNGRVLAALAPGLTPEMVAAVSKLMRNQDLVLVSSKVRVLTRFRNTLGLPGTLATRLQPNHPTDDPAGIAASVVDGLLLACGDAVIGVNPATDSPDRVGELLRHLDGLIQRFRIPTQSCVLAHVTTQLAAMERGAPVDVVFQSIAGTQAANASFGITLSLLREARTAALELKRGQSFTRPRLDADKGEPVNGAQTYHPEPSPHVMYFETGQGSCLSAQAHHGIDQQTLEARAYGVARAFSPLIVNSVVGFIGPEYLRDGREITRAALEDHCCGKLLGLPMGMDVCYTNHADAGQDDMDTILTLLAAAGVNYIMGVPGADDVMLGYQSTSFHDVHYIRQLLGLMPAPEFHSWLLETRIHDQGGRLTLSEQNTRQIGGAWIEGWPAKRES